MFGVRRFIRVCRHFILQTYKRTRRNLTRRGVYTYIARHAVQKGQWSRALVAYKVVLERVKNDPNAIEYINEARLNISVIGRLLEINDYKNSIAKYRTSAKKIKPKVVVFTAISGGYDTLKLPPVLNNNFDYIVFSDTPINGGGIFQVRPMPFYHEDTTRQARYVKTHPHQLLSEYDVAIWIDANIMVLDDLSWMLEEFANSKKMVGAIPHPLRNTLNQEAKACIRYAKDDVEQIKEQAKHYKKLGYETNELIESNIMVFDLTKKPTKDFLRDWWVEIDKFTRRDQLSLNYALDKNNISWHRLMKRPHDSRNHESFTLVSHHLKLPSIPALVESLSSNVSDPFDKRSFTQIRSQVIKEYAQKQVDVVYCVYNALDDVKICLDSVVRHRKSKTVRLIIVDDGSDLPTKEFLKQFAAKHKSWVKLLRKESPSGYTKAANRGLKASTGDMAILLNSDTIVTSGWTEKIAHAVFSTPGAGIVGPLSSAASAQSIPDIKSSSNQTAVNTLPKGLSPDKINEYCESWATGTGVVQVPLVHGFCFGITREAIKAIGYFDEQKFPNGYGEENDYCFRAANAGINLVIATNTYIFHAKSKSYQGEKRVSLMRQGNEMIRVQHGRERIRRSIITMQNHPILESIRNKTSSLYYRFNKIN